MNREMLDTDLNGNSFKDNSFKDNSSKDNSFKDNSAKDNSSKNNSFNEDNINEDSDFEKDNSFKYVMMDTGNIYLGARYSLGELMEAERTPFKLQTIIARYLLKEMDAETTLESGLYYLEKDSFLFKILKQLRVKVKINIITAQKSWGGKIKQQYREQIWTLEQLTAASRQEKQQKGLIVREVILSRLGLMSFSV